MATPFFCFFSYAYFDILILILKLMEETKKCPYCGEEILAIAKKCKHCGEWLVDEEQATEKKMVGCPVCGEPIEEDAIQCPHCKENIVAKQRIEEPPMVDNNSTRSFFDYYFIEPFIRQYMTFKGRLNRKHYWVSMLVWYLLLVGMWKFSNFLLPSVEICDIRFPAGFIWILASIIPLFATATRRLRDVDSRPSIFVWFLLVNVSPLLLFWTCSKSEAESIRTDGLKPDIPQSVKFKKSDIVITFTLVLLFFFGIRGSMLVEEINMNEDDIVLPQPEFGELPEFGEEAFNNNIIKNAIKDYLQGDDDAVYFTESAKQDLKESTWPEAYCSVDDRLASPSEFDSITVSRIAPGLYKYSCICPEHYDKYLDSWTISACISSDNIVEINHVTPDDE
jgi:uncharacterized membrane protein YhaH (DUF805 family)/DNA-directed RNA polymerase subunit RPC12/RpoP